MERGVAPDVRYGELFKRKVIVESRLGSPVEARGTCIAAVV